jgi:hypothetical protein
MRLCVNTESGWRQTRSGWAGSKDDAANENLLDLLDQQAAVQVGQMAIAVATSRMGLTRG